VASGAESEAATEEALLRARKSDRCPTFHSSLAYSVQSHYEVSSKSDAIINSADFTLFRPVI
jgi:hypothetical protein